MNLFQEIFEIRFCLRPVALILSAWKICLKQPLRCDSFIPAVKWRYTYIMHSINSSYIPLPCNEWNWIPSPTLLLHFSTISRSKGIFGLSLNISISDEHLTSLAKQQRTFGNCQDSRIEKRLSNLITVTLSNPSSGCITTMSFVWWPFVTSGNICAWRLQRCILIWLRHHLILCASTHF